MTEEQISKEALQERLETIAQTIPRKQWKYYHIERVQNFIYHLQSFPSDRTQDRMAAKINHYLLLLENKMKEEHEAHQLAKELFPSIWQIATTYVDILGFINKPSYILRLILGIALFYLLELSFGFWAALGLVTVLAIITTFRSEMKVKARKYY